MHDLSFLPRPLDALLVVPPVADVRMPSLAAHLLQACARRHGFAVSVLYANMTFAHRVGLDVCDVLCCGQNHLFGERLFASPAYGLPAFGTDGGGVPDDYEVVRRDGALERTMRFARLKDCHEVVRAWVDETAEAIAALPVRLVGFSTSYQQTSASVALASVVKRRSPHVVTALGGANCRGVMAHGVASLSPALDVIVSGEGEDAFVDLLRQVSAGRPVAERVVTGRACADLDELPLPDYAEYFEQAGRFLPGLDPASLVLSYECVRGCWWGRAHPCAFCGYDATRVMPRQKSAPVVLRDIAELATRYPTRWISISDPAIPRAYLDTVVPALAAERTGASIVWLARAPLSLCAALSFSGAGVSAVEIGVESFSTALLRKLGKGTVAADNVAALRHARIAGLKVFYALLWGIPGDELDDYDETKELLPLLRHLQPPDELVHIRIYRFSPYFETPDRFGLANLRPVPVYRAAFPEGADVEQLAYRWEADFPSASIDRAGDLAWLPAGVQAWQDAWRAPSARPPRLSIRRCPGTIGTVAGGLFVLTDTRGIEGCPDTLLLDAAEARAALTTVDPRASAARSALRHKLAVVLDGTYVPLATADPALIAQLEAEGSQASTRTP